LDVGLSYSAPFSQIWLENEPDLLVIGFEPNPESVENILAGNITKRAPCHGEPIRNEYINNRFFLVPVALSNVENQTEMDFYKMTVDCGTSSLYKPTDPVIGPVKDITKVPVFSLKHFFDLFPWDKYEYIDYMKIDAQGSDFDIIKGAGSYLRERVVYLTAEAETNQYLNCEHNSLSNMETYLLTQGFVRINHPNTEDPTFLNTKFMNLKDKIFIYQK
jgi:FkbM family methyltransferase